MDKKDNFKAFVKQNPKLINYVNNGNMTWQKFYEMYDMYGEDKDAWNDYLGVGVAAATTGVAMTDLVTWLKNIDLDGFQSGINSIQRVLGVVQDLTGKGSTKKEEYKPRPVYKHFED